MACGRRRMECRWPRSAARWESASRPSTAVGWRWKKKFQGMGVAEVRRLRVLEEENRKLKQLVADLSLDKQMPGSRWTEAGARFQPRIHMEVISGLRSEVDRICLATYRSWERVKDEVEVLPDVGPAPPMTVTTVTSYWLRFCWWRILWSHVMSRSYPAPAAASSRSPLRSPSQPR